MLKHPGHLRLYTPIRQWYNCLGMKKEMEEFVKTCKECQKNKITTSKKYGKVPKKEYKDPDLHLNTCI
eukprot:15332728-Ditylum_brightwellii.AAC.1